MATLEDVMKALAFCAAAYPRFKLTKATIRAYHTILEDLPTDALLSAAKQVAANSTFFPAAAELRKMTFELSEGDDLPLAAEGWQQILDSQAMRYVEFFPLTLQTVKVLGGLKQLGQTTNKDLPFVRNEFIKIFNTYRARAKTDRRQLPSVKAYKELQAGKIDDHIKRLTDDLRNK